MKMFSSQNRRRRLLAAALFISSLGLTTAHAQSDTSLSRKSMTAPHVKLQTSAGDILIELNQEKAPATVENFLTYVNDGFYDGTIFHRVINNFMVQGGGFDADMNQKKTRDPIKNEADNGLLNKQYTLAMARTNDPHSATAQFFIN